MREKGIDMYANGTTSNVNKIHNTKYKMHRRTQNESLVLGASTFQYMHAGFLCPKCGNFACLHNRQDQNELHLKR